MDTAAAGAPDIVGVPYKAGDEVRCQSRSNESWFSTVITEVYGKGSVKIKPQVKPVSLMDGDNVNIKRKGSSDEQAKADAEATIAAAGGAGTGGATEAAATASAVAAAAEHRVQLQTVADPADPADPTTSSPDSCKIGKSDVPLTNLSIGLVNNDERIRIQEVRLLKKHTSQLIAAGEDTRNAHDMVAGEIVTDNLWSHVNSRVVVTLEGHQTPSSRYVLKEYGSLGGSKGEPMGLCESIVFAQSTHAKHEIVIKISREEESGIRLSLSSHTLCDFVGALIRATLLTRMNPGPAATQLSSEAGPAANPPTLSEMNEHMQGQWHICKMKKHQTMTFRKTSQRRLILIASGSSFYYLDNGFIMFVRHDEPIFYKDDRPEPSITFKGIRQQLNDLNGRWVAPTQLDYKLTFHTSGEFEVISSAFRDASASASGGGGGGGAVSAPQHHNQTTYNCIDSEICKPAEEGETGEYGTRNACEDNCNYETI